ncbi:MAG: hypothetical protein ONB48_05295 [candidate division KSB1 bacterium]|nr:hypothetical protein [candidate division KSB1 bacterium]MDZ7272963.1 hypothetical protein [candidate division KSB1 bacterium]MDZ7285067.1 hypothetical protein [candidate division KSB1 bacterium]MDZ7298099.1 hypothetical protein [candidate division KSB1 bacterium]MDZ7308224.1 hypothetical protein [candidate division KSB1 bacterium]
MPISRFSDALLLAGVLLLAACQKQPPASQAVPAVAAESARLPLEVGVSLPLDLHMQVVDRSPDGTARIQTTFSPRLAQARVALTITLPEKYELLSGKLNWEGSLKRGETAILDLSVRPRETTPRFVIARAVVTPPEGRVFQQGASVYLDPGQRLEKSVEIRPVKGYEGIESLQIHRPNVAQ